MCTEYWNLTADVECPKGHRFTDELQTHFMGEGGSCSYHYRLGESVDELQGVSVMLDGRNDDFIGRCPECDEHYYYGAEIIDGRVVRVWLLTRDAAAAE